MNTRTACECATFAPAKLLRNWREQRPTSHGDLDTGVTEELGQCIAGGGSASDFIFVLKCMIVVIGYENVERTRTGIQEKGEK
jgi:hypothetical protein